MKTNPSPDELDALLARARAVRPDTDGAQFAFETRMMAKLREKRSESSALFSLAWRMVPFFAICVLGLAFWEIPSSKDAQDSEQTAYVQNQEAVDLLSNFN